MATDTQSEQIASYIRPAHFSAHKVMNLVAAPLPAGFAAGMDGLVQAEDAGISNTLHGLREREGVHHAGDSLSRSPNAKTGSRGVDAHSRTAASMFRFACR